MSRICIVLLAAGCSSRFGSPKLLSPLGDSTLVGHAAHEALKTGMSLIVVTGAYADKIKSELEGIEARLVHNSDWEKGMGASVATAFNYLLSEKALFDAAIICPADMPLVGASQFQRLIDAHQQSPQRIIVSDLGEAQGPPCLFPRSYFEELAKLCGPQGARTLLIEHKAAISSISMPEATMDVDTTEDYARLIHQQCSA